MEGRNVTGRGAAEPPQPKPLNRVEGFRSPDDERDGAWYAREIDRVLRTAWEAGITPLFGPHPKIAVTLRYVNGEPVDIERIVISIDHADVIDENEAREILRPFVLQVVPVEWMCDDEHFVVYSLRQYVKFDESNTDVDLYSGAGDAPGIVDDLAAYFAVARRAFEKGLSVAELDEAIDDKLAAKAAARETTGRATAQPRPAETDDLNTAVKQAKAENLARAGASAALQLATYKALVKNVDLQNPALAPDERLRRANRLLAAYERVRAARRNFKDSNVQLTAARRIQKAAYREGQRAKRPPAPRGRPRKLVAT